MKKKLYKYINNYTWLFIYPTKCSLWCLCCAMWWHDSVDSEVTASLHVQFVCARTVAAYCLEFATFTRCVAVAAHVSNVWGRSPTLFSIHNNRTTHIHCSRCEHLLVPYNVHIHANTVGHRCQTVYSATFHFPHRKTTQTPVLCKPHR
jgi:hypothetical protein